MITASIASIPSREHTLELTIESLRPQVDFFQLYLNGYNHEPLVLQRITAVVHRSQDNGDCGDAGKFYDPPHTGYHLTCDDDLEYPPDYAERMCAAVDRYEKRAAVGLHGVILTSPLGRTYEESRRGVFHFAEELPHYQPVHLLGTGCLAYHTSALSMLSHIDFPEPNMADIWFALACQKRGVPRICVPHEAGWVRQLPFENSIWDERKDDPKLVEALKLGEPWELQTTEAEC